MNSELDAIPGTRALFVHPDNIGKVRERLSASVAVIARPNDFMRTTQPIPMIVETEQGVHTRCYLARHGDTEFVIIYGRVGLNRVTSGDLDYRLTQRVVDFLGIELLIGHFIGGSTNPNMPGGQVVVPTDFVGLGQHKATNAIDGPFGFRTVDMYWPFCMPTRELVAESVYRDESGPERCVYATFHGWPRIETAAELANYASQGFDVVGQTMDPEATLAKESGTHYAAVVCTVDDAGLRQASMEGEAAARAGINDLVLSGRKRMFDHFLETLPRLVDYADKPTGCDCHEQAERRRARSEHMYYRPSYLCVDR